MNDNIFSKLHLNKKDFVYIFGIFILCFMISFLKINFYKEIGFNSDVPIYLSNALYYAGINYHNIFGTDWIYSSPVMAFITSIFFRMGFVTPTSIYIVTAIFEVIGAIGLYIFLKNRFNSILSFLGTIFYLSTYIFLFSASSGMLDTPAVAISIWILIFFIISINKNPKYYIVTSLLFFIGFFLRPTVGFVLLPMIVCYLIEHDIIKLFDEFLHDKDSFKKHFYEYLKSSEFKYICFSILLFIISFGIVVLINYLMFNIHMEIFNKAVSSGGGMSGFKGVDIGYFPDHYFYLDRIFYYIAYPTIDLFNIKLSEAIVSVIVIGLIVRICDLFRNFIKQKNYNQIYKTPFFSENLMIIGLIFLIISILGFKFNHFIINLSLMVSLIIFGSLIKKYDLNRENFYFFMINFTWMLTYLIFISFISIKVSRYFLPVMVVISYLFILAIKSIFDVVGDYLTKKGINKQVILKILILIIVCVLVISTLITISHLGEVKENVKYSKIYRDTHDTAGYLMELDKDYMDKNITVDHSYRFYNWFLQRNTTVIDNLYQSVSMFDQGNSEYIFLNESIEFENYTEIYHHGDSYLYQRNNYL